MRSIRARIILSCIAVGAVVLGVELVYVMGPLSASLGALADAQARRLALIVADRLDGVEELALEARQIAVELAPRLNRRVTVLSLDGRSLADSSGLAVEPDVALAGEEVRGALAKPGVIASCERVSTDDNVAYRFAAVTVPRRGAARAIVRVGLPLGEVDALRSAQLRAVLIAGAVGLAVTLLLGAVLARRAVAQLEEVAEAALAIGKGELGRRAPIVGDDILRGLARSLNELAENQLQRLLALARDRALLLALLDATAEGVAVVDAQGVIVVTNGRFREIVRAPESPEGRALGELLGDKDLALAVRRAAGAAAHAPESVTTTRTTSRPRPEAGPAVGEELEEESCAVRVRLRPVELPGIGPGAICLVETLERAKDELQAEVARLLDELAGARSAEVATVREALDLARAALDLETRPAEPEVVAGTLLGKDVPSVFVTRGRLELALALLRLDGRASAGFAVEVGPARVALLLPDDASGRGSLARRLAFTAIQAAGGSIERGADGKTRVVLPRA